MIKRWLDRWEKVEVPNGAGIVAVAALSAYLLIFVEWMFFVTAPSFLNSQPWSEQFLSLLLAPLPLAVGAAVLSTTILLSWHRVGRWPEKDVAAAAVVPALIFALTFVLVIDNVTYTVFSFGIITVRGTARFLYAGLTAVLFAMFYSDLFIFTGWMAATKQVRRVAEPALVLVLVSVLAVFIRLAGSIGGHIVSPAGALTKHPDIFLISSDGLEAEYMSLYGGPKGNTPFIDEWSKDALVFENSFCNANKTAASLASLLVGCSPITNHKYSSSQILKRPYSFTHLPGMLRSMGYKTVQIGTPSHDDARAWNMREGFDLVNGVSMDGRWDAKALDFLGPDFDTDAYLLGETLSRSAQRMRHAFGGPLMENPMGKKSLRKGPRNDTSRVSSFAAALKEAGDRPLFVQMHLMLTHPSNNFEHRRPLQWKIDRYNHEVRVMDREFERAIAALRESGRYDNSLVVFFSDHGILHVAEDRIPMIIHFPTGRPGNIELRDNVQNLDLAPTILDYLGLPIPAYMEGTSLLRPRERLRPIYASGVGNSNHLRFVNALVGDRIYRVNVSNGAVTLLRVPGHPYPLASDLIPERVIEQIKAFLTKRKVKVSQVAFDRFRDLDDGKSSEVAWKEDHPTSGTKLPPLAPASAN